MEGVMTKPELEQALAEANATIEQFQVRVAEGDAARDRVLELERQVAQLAEQLSKMVTPDAFTMLAKAWVNSAIGKRANNEPEIDQIQIQTGLIMKDFDMIRSAYTTVCIKLTKLGKPPTKEEQAEIQQAMHQAGFI
jgi:predicted nuclease with TOPRIM domain